MEKLTNFEKFLHNMKYCSTEQWNDYLKEQLKKFNIKIVYHDGSFTSEYCKKVLWNIQPDCELFQKWTIDEQSIYIIYTFFFDGTIINFRGMLLNLKRE